MKKSVTRGSIAETRMLTIDQACTYTGMGKTTCRKWCEEIGAVRRFGSMVRYDKMIIDQVFEQMDREGRKKDDSENSGIATSSAREIARQMYEDPDIQTIYMIKMDMDPARFAMLMKLIRDVSDLELRSKY